ncbi:amino acid ABC transporter substrate-binding protein [Marinobacter sp. BW6]|uniref:substrate-binding periplasmic protein n=1 Tax=Marinobacter sp. BW6 TaxID=2592624 RepID=UPI0011DEAF0B|nr:transporter substrate-binding domain-containing protein [Marinobacter sp. BW6]TYC57337.1 amino acid ABC transporter substrate-binding protein [Marinobacter sp. BW6]
MYTGKSNGFPFSQLLPLRLFGPVLRKSALVLASVLCFAAPSYGDCDITLRWDDDPPYFMLKEDEVVGIDADLAREAMERLGCSLSLQKLPWARALRELRDGRVDMLSGAYRTPEREQYAHYSEVVGLVSPNILFVRRSDKARFDFSGLRVLLESDFRLGAQINVSYSDEYSALVQNPDYEKNIQYLSRRESLWRMLARNRIDGVVASRLTGLYEIKELGLSGAIVPSSLVVSNKPAFFVFSKASVGSEFVADFDLALRAMLDDGTFAAIVNRYVCVHGDFGLAEAQTDTGACPLAIR